VVSRRGIALPVVLLVLVALGLLSSLALGDALLAARVAALAEDEVRARSAAVSGDSALRHPPDLVWLCLQPPSAPQRRVLVQGDGARVEISWWMVGSGLVRVQVTGVGPAGGRHRRLGWLRPDSLIPLDSRPGCPEARALIPAAINWRAAHPEG
jgi:hypothetical protein